MKTPKQEALELLQQLPDDVSFERLIYELDFKFRVLRGIAQSERGEGIPHEEVKRRLSRWLESPGRQRLSETESINGE